MIGLELHHRGNALPSLAGSGHFYMKEGVSSIFVISPLRLEEDKECPLDVFGCVRTDV